MKNVFILLFFIGICLHANAQVEWSSHRGSSIHAPENTIAAVRLAWEQGADAVEIDIRLSKDNKLIVIHDSNTKRTSGKDYRVEDTVSDTLRRLDVGSFKGQKYKNERIPFLEEIIDLTPPSKTLYIELKCGLDALPVLQAIINKSPKKERLALIGGGYETMVAAKKMFPDHSCHLLIGKKDNMKELIKSASLNGIDAIDMKHSLIDQEIVDYIHSLSMGIYAWTVDDPQDAKRLLELHLNGIETNCVPCLKKLLDNTTKEYNILNYGAKPDGVTLNTKAIQKAIDAATQAGGGKVIVPEGKFLTGPIVLKSNIDFHIVKGGVILGSTRIADYRISERQNEVAPALVFAERVSNLSISGEGTINGQGRELAHHLDSLFHVGKWEHYNHNCKIPEGRIKNTEIRKSKNIRIAGVTFQNANEWTFHAEEVEGLTIQNARINSDAYWNNDGFDITDCKDVLITGCDVNAADDGICLKSENRLIWNDNIRIENCRVRSSASAIKFGTSSHGGFKNVIVRNIEVYDTYRSAIALESVDGGIMENILVEDFKVTNTGNAIFIRLGKRNRDKAYSTLKNVIIRNMKAEIPFGRPDGDYELLGPPVAGFYNTFPSSITGLPGQKVENVTIENVEIIYPGRGNNGLAHIPLYRLHTVPEIARDYPEFSMFGELPAWGMYVRHVEGLTFKNVTLVAKAKDYRPAYVFDDVDGLTMEGITISEDDTSEQIILRNVRNEQIKADPKTIRVIPPIGMGENQWNPLEFN